MNFSPSRCSSLYGLIFCLLVSACETMPVDGPSTKSIVKLGADTSNTAIKLVDVDEKLTKQLGVISQKGYFSNTLAKLDKPTILIGTGDMVEITIWEAPPAMLFGGGGLESVGKNQQTVLPAQMVNSAGFISVPFVGQVRAAGKTNTQVETYITSKLSGKANHPQVNVGVPKNNASNVTIVGEVVNSLRMPLTPKGEKLLDAIAAAGGVRQPVGKMTVQVTRGNTIQTLPLETIIKDPRQNIYLQPGDVVTAMYQPFSFTVLGATSKNEEINFEGQGITLTQALARSGGLQDNRSDASGVFVFRYEDPAILNPDSEEDRVVLANANSEGKVPVIYRLNLKDPASFFWAQNFPVRNRDILYVSNSPSTEFSKFLSLLTSGIYSIGVIKTLTP